VAAIILGGVYYFANNDNDSGALPPEVIEQVSSDTTLKVIDEELNNTDIDTLDQEFADIDEELEAALTELNTVQ